MSERDWAAWSREAVQLMEARDDGWRKRYGLSDGAHYHWDLQGALLVFPSSDASLKADITVVGGVSKHEGTFLWAWANDAIPAHAKRGMEKVRDFGVANDLGLLITPEWPGGHPDGLEMLALAGRILDSEGAWVAPHGDGALYFLLSGFRKEEDLPPKSLTPS